MRAAPPTRYKVVERGRRLEVLDSWNGDAPVKPGVGVPQAPARRDAAPPLRTMRPRTGVPSPGILSTRGWYDAKGPRDIVLTDAGKAKLNGLKISAGIAAVFAAISLWFFWPVIFFMAFLFLRKDARATLRRGATTFIDRINDR